MARPVASGSVSRSQRRISAAPGRAFPSRRARASKHVQSVDHVMHVNGGRHVLQHVPIRSSLPSS
eukprot:15484212-Alexandrium_andersonii.AAC.1